MAPTIINTVPLGILLESRIYGLPFLEGGVIFGMMDDDVEFDERNEGEEEETAVVVEEAAVDDVAVVNFGSPLLEIVIFVILVFQFELISSLLNF